MLNGGALLSGQRAAFRPSVGSTVPGAPKSVRSTSMQLRAYVAERGRSATDAENVGKP
jgi:hypothetical protein